MNAPQQIVGRHTVVLRVGLAKELLQILLLIGKRLLDLGHDDAHVRMRELRGEKENPFRILKFVLTQRCPYLFGKRNHKVLTIITNYGFHAKC